MPMLFHTVMSRYHSRRLVSSRVTYKELILILLSLHTCSSERKRAARQAARRAARVFSSSGSVDSRPARRLADFADGLTPPVDALEYYNGLRFNTFRLETIIPIDK